MPAALPRIGSALVLATLLAGCTSDVTGAPSPASSSGPGRGVVELVRGDACGEVFFWAASASGEVAVTVHLDVVDRPAEGPSGYTVPLPHPDVTVAVLTGTGDLTEDFCTDTLLGPEPTGEQDAVAGTVVITVDPPGEDCGESDGRLQIDGLVAEDGTTFAPVDVRSGDVGCNVGG